MVRDSSIFDTYGQKEVSEKAYVSPAQRISEYSQSQKYLRSQECKKKQEKQIRSEASKPKIDKRSLQLSIKAKK